MDATIADKSSLRVFAKTMRLMAKYSNELILQALPDELKFNVVNAPQTAVIQSIFAKKFFVNYEVGEREEDNEAKVHFRPLLHCMKNHKTVSYFCALISQLDLLNLTLDVFHSI
jgi:hypothetical protein